MAIWGLQCLKQIKSSQNRLLVRDKVPSDCYRDFPGCLVFESDREVSGCHNRSPNQSLGFRVELTAEIHGQYTAM